MAGELGWLIGLGVSFLCGGLLGYAFKVKQHDREIESILNVTRRHRSETETEVIAVATFLDLEGNTWQTQEAAAKFDHLPKGTPKRERKGPPKGPPFVY
jgi:hypothetical protein